MTETIEFRIPESDASKHLPDSLGTKLGIARRVELSFADPLVAQIGEIDREFRSRGDAFFTAWVVHRHYTTIELAEAEIFAVSIKKVFEPAGEECGTQYDDRLSCGLCGGGRRQITPLFLNGARIPSRVDICQTIAGEVVASRRCVDVFRQRKIDGVTFEAVRLANSGGTQSEEHYRLIPGTESVRLADATRVGDNPFDHAQAGRCPNGDVVGLNLLSEVWIQRPTCSNNDVVATRELIGVRRGLLRPRPLLLISPRARLAIDDSKLKGFVLEVAHLT